MSSLAEPLLLPQWSHNSSKPILRLVLLIAVTIHALLLLIPARTPEFPLAPKTLEVDFNYLPRSEPTRAADPLPPLPAESPDQAVEPLSDVQPIPVPVPRSDPAPPEATLEPMPDRAITTALLLEQVRERAIDIQAPVIRVPGVPFIPALPENLTRPVLPLQFNAFDDYVITGEQEIIDQWMEPGGAINAVVRLPNGEIVCGRAEPWDEMNPLYEPVAMYRSCGGGGKRSSSVRSPFSLRE